MLDLFTPIVESEKQHYIFKILSNETMYAERNVILDWADGFVDRDNKFVKEFQTTFESSLMELYLNKILKSENIDIDYKHNAPDFVCNKNGSSFCIEATIANPEKDGQPAYGFTEDYLNFDIDFKEFNRKSIIRIANSIVTKSQKYTRSYCKYPHVIGKPFILGLNSFDRPHSHFIGHRGLMAVLYGIYLNEERAISEKLNYIPRERMDFIEKDNGAEIQLGFFTTPEYEHISGVIYNPYANWGKVQALAEVTEANKYTYFNALYTTDEVSEEALTPDIRNGIPKEEYSESIFDGLYIFHNPHAKYPIPEFLFNHPEIAHFSLNEAGNIIERIDGRFLLSRGLIGLRVNSMIPK
ncbi:hypothetical protein [Acinetobacter nosocomialis]|uniref:hypothetical protein n=1 Tax=Acinetobacter nosocomialis TaxID=106654 RepID=UPI002FF01124